MLRQRVLECGRGDCDGFDFGEASIRALRSCSAQFDNNDFKLQGDPTRLSIVISL